MNKSLSRYYKLLNVSETASRQQIKDAVKILLKKYHPDKHVRHKKWAETQTKRILEAYQCLVKETGKEPHAGVKSNINVIIRQKKKSFLELKFLDAFEQKRSLLVDIRIVDQVVKYCDVQETQDLSHFVLYKGRRILLLDQYLFNTGQLDSKHVQFLLLYKTSYPNCLVGFRFYQAGATREILDEDLKEYPSVELSSACSLRCTDNGYIMLLAEYNRMLRKLIRHPQGN